MKELKVVVGIVLALTTLAGSFIQSAVAAEGCAQVCRLVPSYVNAGGTIIVLPVAGDSYQVTTTNTFSLSSGDQIHAYMPSSWQCLTAMWDHPFMAYTWYNCGTNWGYEKGVYLYGAYYAYYQATNWCNCPKMGGCSIVETYVSLCPPP